MIEGYTPEYFENTMKEFSAISAPRRACQLAPEFSVSASEILYNSQKLGILYRAFGNFITFSWSRPRISAKLGGERISTKSWSPCKPQFETKWNLTFDESTKINGFYLLLFLTVEFHPWRTRNFKRMYFSFVSLWSSTFISEFPSFSSFHSCVSLCFLSQGRGEGASRNPLPQILAKLATILLFPGIQLNYWNDVHVPRRMVT